MAFPKGASAQLITDICTRFNFNFEALCAMIYIESDPKGDIHSANSSGALGLTQVIPGQAGTQVRNVFGLRENDDDMFFDPMYNLKYCCLYLGYLYDTYKTEITKDPTFLLRAYNGGPGDAESAAARNYVVQWKSAMDVLKNLSTPSFSINGNFKSPLTMHTEIKSVASGMGQKYTTEDGHVCDPGKLPTANIPHIPDKIWSDIYGWQVGSTSSSGSANFESTEDSAYKLKFAEALTKGIVDFAAFMQSKVFFDNMKQQMGQMGDKTLLQYIQAFISKFYHEILICPTLASYGGGVESARLKETITSALDYAIEGGNLGYSASVERIDLKSVEGAGCYALMVKPECMFFQPPRCNVVYPTMRSNMSLNRNYKAEPTRYVLVSDPIMAMFGEGAQPSPTQLITGVGMAYHTDSAGNINSINENQASPQLFKKSDEGNPAPGAYMRPTTFEEDHSVRVVKEAGGSDLYLFLASGGSSSTTKNKATKTQNSMYKIDFQDIQSSPDCMKGLQNLAEYNLLRARYLARTAGISSLFNPYAVPGFPMYNIGYGVMSSTTVIGYITNISHTLSPGGSQTTMQAAACRYHDEQFPGNKPLIEKLYSENLTTVYEEALGYKGEAVAQLDAAMADFGSSAWSLEDTYKRIWRRLPTLEEYAVYITGSTRIVVSASGYIALVNTNGFFIPEAGETGATLRHQDTRNKIREYAHMVQNYQAFSNKDIY